MFIDYVEPEPVVQQEEQTEIETEEVAPKKVRNANRNFLFKLLAILQ